MKTSSTAHPLGGRRPARPSDPLALLAHLTVRDRRIVETLGEHQVLTTDQLADFAFPSPSMARHRLVTLYRLGVLDRFRWHTTAGSKPWHYTLGPAGAALLAAAAGTDPPRPAELRRRAARLATSPRLRHLLGVNGFFTALAAHARTHPGAALSTWLSEQRCAQRYGRIVRPDAFGAWTQGEQRVEFFLEYDTGTEPLTRVLAKLPGYANLAAAGGPACPVLFWLPTAAREANLRRLLANQPVSVPVATASRDWADVVGEDPAGPVWLAARSDRRLRLVDLAAHRVEAREA